MCGISAILEAGKGNPFDVERRLRVMVRTLRHRGPDGEGVFTSENAVCGLGHVRLSIIDPENGQQPMKRGLHAVTFNGEIYNYRELREELSSDFSFTTTCDTEVLLAAYQRWGTECVKRLRGMFAFVIWDEREGHLFVARDRFGIKPLYYFNDGHRLILASEIKALLPFVRDVRISREALKEYLAFQFTLDGKTLFAEIEELEPASYALVKPGEALRSRTYWEVRYDLDWHHTDRYFVESTRDLLHESVNLHLRSDVPIGTYVSGGRDSGIISALAADMKPEGLLGFTGKFTSHSGYDESAYAHSIAGANSFPLIETDITSQDFIDNIRSVIYHLDVPVAGPGSFPQYMVSKTVGQSRKVVLGGQGGDEIFGGYVRYLVAYFEQCIKGAIEGTLDDGNFVVTYESIIPSLPALQQYVPMLREFWKDGVFEPIDHRYFRLVNRAPSLADEVRWAELGEYDPFDTFSEVFWGEHVGKNSYFDLMTHFDFKTLLPALLQVEDRMSMAHGVESRVPFLDHPLIELLATAPSSVKFAGGQLKHLMTESFDDLLPRDVVERTDKMGFPVPLSEWLQGDLRDFVVDQFSSKAARERDYFDSSKILQGLDREPRFGRKIWGLLCLELWCQEFIDKSHSSDETVTDVR